MKNNPTKNYRMNEPGQTAVRVFTKKNSVPGIQLTTGFQSLRTLNLYFVCLHGY
ncbi:hypothetical protein NBRC111894_4216 [Sporolactobacillus inulinus]|uniref:Uncharacterized protein n=1 Tax=Sporolactobacillus inulinus TaxID=2078 RepID=A0A4Y1ZHJ0_9BACL|nr:hypothetical protein NBRC111894_4216 [Sporolactobacillus inulinus]